MTARNAPTSRSGRSNPDLAATITTLASPSLNGTTGLSVWTVEMQANQRGPAHTFDSEQIWTVLDGELTVALDDETIDVHGGDTIVFPARAIRKVTAAATSRILVCGRADAIVHVPGEETPRGTPEWIA